MICYMIRLSAWIWIKGGMDARMRDFYDSNLGIFYDFSCCLSIFSHCLRLIISLMYANCEAFMHPILLHHIKKKEKFNRDKVYKYQNFSLSRKLST